MSIFDNIHNNKIPCKTQTAVAIAGSVDSGKSTFIGVTTSNMLDNGNGSARKQVAIHPHEVTSGQTSDISTKILDTNNGNGITFIDLCGHEKYLKTTARGISGYFPDYGCIIVSPQRGVLPMTVQHYKMLISHNIPIFIIITRIDNSMEKSYQEVIKSLIKMCSKLGGQKVDIINNFNDYQEYKNLKNDFIDNTDNFAKKKVKDIETIKTHIEKNKKGKQIFVPVISVSNVNGYYIDVIKKVMNNLKPRNIWEQTYENNRIIKVFKNRLGLQNIDFKQNLNGSVFYIENSFNPVGVGFVISGILRGKEIKFDDTLYLGPFGKEFLSVKIKSIHNNNKQLINSLSQHDRGCIALNIKNKKNFNITKKNLNRGVILISKVLKNFICYRFKAAIYIFTDKSISIKPGYSPVIHLGNIQQTVRVLKDETFEEEIIDKNNRKISKKILGPGSIDVMWFKFKVQPQFVEKGSLFTFRSGNIHGVGWIIDTLPIEQDTDAMPDRIKKRYSKK